MTSDSQVSGKARRIIVLAGPSCCGKTTLAGKLLAGELPQVAAACGLTDPKAWNYIDIWLDEAKVLEKLSDPEAQLLLHYTIPYPALKFMLRMGYDKPLRHSILQGSQDVTLLTLVADGDTLVTRVDRRETRVRERRREGLVPIHKFVLGLRRLRALQRVYSNPNLHGLMYRNWFEYASTLQAKCLTVDVSEEPTIVANPHFARPETTEGKAPVSTLRSA